MNINKSRQRQRGAVSLFIVIFTALLVTVISVSFIRIMTQTQQQAVTADLSQSAHDSALAGVEDAKRLLVEYARDCQQVAVPAEKCSTLDRLLRTETPCNTIQQAGIEGSATDKEVLVKRVEGDRALDQAYTCVKVMLETNDYIGNLNRGVSRVVPLKGVSNFNEVVLQWYSQVDLQNSSDDAGERSISLPDAAENLALPRLSDWPASRPTLMRAQLIQVGGSFNLSDFDKAADGSSNAHTLFLYPLSAGRDAVDFAEDVRLSQAGGVLHGVTCDRTFSAATSDKAYACKVTLRLPNAVGATDTARTAFMRLDAIYNTTTHFSVALQNNGTPVKFKDVQPIVDSTGRANDLFRRVESRIELDVSTFPYPDAAIDITGNLCKNFLVTDNPADYVSNADECDPTRYTSE